MFVATIYVARSLKNVYLLNSTSWTDAVAPHAGAWIETNNFKGIPLHMDLRRAPCGRVD
jgi:hypothetical protein